MQKCTRFVVLAFLARPLIARSEKRDFAVQANLIEDSTRKATAKGGTFLPVNVSETVSVSFIKLGDDPWRMGILQKMRVNAPLDRLVHAIDDTDGYVGIFDDLKKSERRDIKSPDDYVLFTETEIPLPFVPNDKTSMHYRIERKTNSVLYRFDLTEGNHLLSYNGVALAASDGAQSSVYWELDLYEPGFGMSRALPVKKFWIQNAESSVQSDWALKEKAEKPNSKPEEILADSKKRAEALDDTLAKAYEGSTSFESLLAQAIPATPNTNANAKNPLSPASSMASPKHNGPKSDPNP